MAKKINTPKKKASVIKQEKQAEQAIIFMNKHYRETMKKLANE